MNLIICDSICKSVLLFQISKLKVLWTRRYIWTNIVSENAYDVDILGT